MKSIVFALVFIIITACSDSKEHAKDATLRNAGNETSNNSPIKNGHTASSINPVISSYINLKNALGADNDRGAASAGKQLSKAMEAVDQASFSADQKKMFDDIKEDIKENAEHIGDNAGKIEHQREHFDLLSQDMYDLVKSFKSSETLYRDHCPMYKDGKGAAWLSEVKEIKNPYLGKKMLTCGTIKEELRP
jgi:hypothetical protein